MSRPNNDSHIFELKDDLLKFRLQLREMLLLSRGMWLRYCRLAGIQDWRVRHFAHGKLEWLSMYEMFRLYAVMTHNPIPEIPQDPPPHVRRPSLKKPDATLPPEDARALS